MGHPDLTSPETDLVTGEIPHVGSRHIMVNKRIGNAVLGCNLKKDRMISVHFQGKPYKITVIQVYDPTSNTEEMEVE